MLFALDDSYFITDIHRRKTRDEPAPQKKEITEAPIYMTDYTITVEEPG